MEHFIQQIPIVPENELKDLMSMLKREITKWEEASINNPDYPLYKKYRDTDLFHVDASTSVGILLHNYLNKGAEEYGEKLRTEYGEDIMLPPIMTAWGTSSMRQGMQILRYRPGQFYNYHIDKDYKVVCEESSRRTLSVVLYLTDDYTGGGTEFPGKVYKPKAGEALYFPAEWSYPHKAQPVLQGEKWVCVTWYEVYCD